MVLPHSTAGVAVYPFTILTAIAISGSKAGAYPTNKPWSGLVLTSCAVPDFPAAVLENPGILCIPLHPRMDAVPHLGRQLDLTFYFCILPNIIHFLD